MADRNGIVLITGATGHVGFAVLKYAIQHDFKVRIAVRNQAKADLLSKNSVVQEASKKPGYVSFVIIPDFLVEGAFDEAVQDVKYIMHVASPIPYDAPEDPEKWYDFLIVPAVKGTVGVLESAAKFKSVQRIVITSSAASIRPGLSPDGDQTISDADSRSPDIEPPFANSMVAYVASKVAAFNRTEEWLKERKPHFDVISIHPSFVLGRDDLATSTKRFQSSTNSIPLNIALGVKGGAMTNGWNYVGDTAKVHVESLNPAIKGNQSFLVSSTGQDGMTWMDTTKIIAAKYPQEVTEGLFPNNGSLETVIAKVDISKTEDTFGKLSPYETALTSIIDHYLELVRAEK